MNADVLEHKINRLVECLRDMRMQLNAAADFDNAFVDRVVFDLDTFIVKQINRLNAHRHEAGR